MLRELISITLAAASVGAAIWLLDAVQRGLPEALGNEAADAMTSRGEEGASADRRDTTHSHNSVLNRTGDGGSI